MPIPPHISAAITRFETAAQAVTFKGSAAPDERTAIVHQHQTARDALVRAIEKAISK